MKSNNKKFAIISVSDKRNIDKLAKELISQKYIILSTGGTAKFLTAKKIKNIAISDFTEFEEILEGRVKTLHPKIHAGILAKNQSSLSNLKKLDYYLIDMVVVNLYPFENTISKKNCTFENAIENIDIGGPTMLRAAAKNHQRVTVVTEPDDYDKIINELKVSHKVSSQTRLQLAKKVFKKISAYETNNNSLSNFFYWSEGSVLLGKVGDSSISSAKDIKTNSFTLGLDKFTENSGIKGVAFRFGNEDVDVGSNGSNLDANTYNITYYSTSPIKDDTKHVDTIIGIGKIRSNILTVVDDNNHTANRTGQQIYFTHKIKDEVKKNNLTLIPSAQIDFGHTILNKYSETGNLGLTFEDQHIRTRNLRGAIAFYEDLSNEKIKFKRHGKLEYLADLYQSSDLNYKYNSGGRSLNTSLSTGATHNLNGEIGLDIILPEGYSVFIIYERNQALDNGHNDNIYVALGYLPRKDTEYAFTLNGSENLMSKLEIKKDINGFDLSFNLNDDLTRLGDAREAYIEINKVF